MMTKADIKSCIEVQRNYHIELLRIAACFAVIVIHISGSNQNSTLISNATWQIFNVFNSLGRFSVPCFVMISGIFLLSPERNITIKELYLKRIPKIAFIWIVWEVFYAVVDFVWRKEAFSPAAILTIGQTALTGHYHLWYLPMLLGLYIATPILRALTEKKDKKLCLYVLVVLFVFGSLEPTLLLLGLKGTIPDVIDKLQLTLFSGYIGYYLLGFFLYTYPLTKRLQTVFYSLAVFGALSTVLFENYYPALVKSTGGIGLDFISVPVVLMSIGIFVFFKEQVSKITLRAKSMKIIGSISSCTFGIYLLHAFVVERLYNLGLTTLSFSPAIAVIFISIVGFSISLIIVYLIRKIPVVRKYLV